MLKYRLITSVPSWNGCVGTCGYVFTRMYAVHRLAKEKQMYEQEVVDQAVKIEKMKSEQKDEYDIKKQVC